LEIVEMEQERVFEDAIFGLATEIDSALERLNKALDKLPGVLQPIIDAGLDRDGVLARSIDDVEAAKELESNEALCQLVMSFRYWFEPRLDKATPEALAAREELAAQRGAQAG
jgi:hypothetical protein